MCACLFGTGCGDAAKPTAAAPAAAAKPTNRIPVPETVRRNLGITFAKTEYRQVVGTIRVPGRFVSPPEAVRAWHGPARGRVEPVVQAFQPVVVGTVLYRVDSPAWREHQRTLAALEAGLTHGDGAVSEALAERAQAERALAAMTAAIPVHRERAATLDATVELWTTRVTALEAIQQAGGGRAGELAEARSRLAAARSARAESLEHQSEHVLEHARVDAALNRQGDAPSRLTAAITAARAARDAAQADYAIALRTAAALTGLTSEQLVEAVPVALGTPLTPAAGTVPRWRAIELLEVRSDRVGIVEAVQVTAGAWVEEATLVLSVVDPTRLRFATAALQADLPRLRDGQAVRIAPPAGLSPNDALPGTLAIAPRVDSDSRTVPLAVVPTGSAAWARPGVTTVAEITVAGGQEELAIPRAAVIQDDLAFVLFRRDRKDPDQVIRFEADIGVSDGAWVVVNSGLKEGDEVVLGGIYELILTGGGKATGGGHFHADGTYHEGHD